MRNSFEAQPALFVSSTVLGHRSGRTTEAILQCLCTVRHAALEAGYSPKGATVQASRLLECSEIRARIDAPQADVVGRNYQRVDAFLSKLEASYDGALSNHQFHAAVRTVELQVKLSGLVGNQAGSL